MFHGDCSIVFHCDYVSMWLCSITVKKQSDLVFPNVFFFSRRCHFLKGFVSYLLACLMFQQHVSAPKRRICVHGCSRRHTEIERAEQTFYLTQSGHTDTVQTVLELAL